MAHRMAEMVHCAAWMLGEGGGGGEATPKARWARQAIGIGNMSRRKPAAMPSAIASHQHAHPPWRATRRAARRGIASGDDAASSLRIYADAGRWRDTSAREVPCPSALGGRRLDRRAWPGTAGFLSGRRLQVRIVPLSHARVPPGIRRSLT